MSPASSLDDDGAEESLEGLDTVEKRTSFWSSEAWIRLAVKPYADGDTGLGSQLDLERLVSLFPPKSEGQQSAYPI